MDIFKETRIVSDLNTNKQILFRILKMQEELGELATAYLKITRYKNPKFESEEAIQENIREEIADIFLVSIDLVHIIEMSEDELCERVMQKLPKWEENISKFLKYNSI